eukprot:9307624-Lingulodinium_polyedra.AAC.1
MTRSSSEVLHTRPCLEHGGGATNEHPVVGNGQGRKAPRARGRCDAPDHGGSVDVKGQLV